MPVGYCAEADATPKSHRHKTEKEARGCYRNWLLDTDLRLGVAVDKQHDCAICFRKTQKVAAIDGEMIYLCDSHMARESVEKLFDLPGQMIEIVADG